MSGDCQRCAAPAKRAAFLIPFAVDGADYEIRLCDRHSELFDREMLAWTRLADEVTRPALGAAGVRDTGPIPFPVTDGGEVVHDDRVPRVVEGEIHPDALAFTFTEHATMRMVHRRMTRGDIYRAISSRDKTDLPCADRPDCRKYIWRDVVAVVNPTQRRVVTVFTRAEDENLMKGKTSNG